MFLSFSKETSRSEARRRLAWLLEEQERRRRIREEQTKAQNQLNSRANSNPEKLVTAEEFQMERVKEELLRKVDAYQTRKMENEEKLRRTVEEVVEDMKLIKVLPSNMKELLQYQVKSGEWILTPPEFNFL